MGDYTKYIEPNSSDEQFTIDLGDGNGYASKENKKFVLETESAKPEVKTWIEIFREALDLARKIGFKPSNVGFCIFEDSDGNKFKYDADEQDFVYYE